VFIATLYHYYDALEVLCAHPRVDVNFLNRGMTAIKQAASYIEPRALQILLNNASLDVNARDTCKDREGTALMSALYYERVDNARLLLADRRMDPAAADGRGVTALHYAAKHCRVYMTALLLADGRFDPNVKDSANKTALHYAAERSVAMFRLLLTNGRIRVTPTNKNGLFMCAVKAGAMDVAQLLCQEYGVCPVGGIKWQYTFGSYAVGRRALRPHILKQGR
jgi:ankyrin repeat protein